MSKAVFSSLLVLGLVLASISQLNALSEVHIKHEKLTYTDEAQTRELFRRFVRDYNRTYTGLEAESRYQVFNNNVRRMRVYERTDGSGATYGFSKFADYKPEEFLLNHGMAQMKLRADPLWSQKVQWSQSSSARSGKPSSLPREFDWRTSKSVSAVKNQGACGSCWAFSVVGNIESQWFLKHGQLFNLSVQQLVDCDREDMGCNGGLPETAYKMIKKIGGLEKEREYPYEADQKMCHMDKSKIMAHISDWKEISSDETELAEALMKTGPLSVALDANLLQFYMGGIFHPWKIFCNSYFINHAVLLVGFGEEKGKPYWIVKNSWGSTWGEEGYFRIHRGDGTCGINTYATTAIL